MHPSNSTPASPARSHIRIHFSDAEGALTRTLLTLARRGWSVVDMHARRSEGQFKLEAQLEATPLATPLPAPVLQRQLARLHDVREVTLLKTHRRAREDLAPC